MSTIINPNYNSQPRQVELNKQKIIEILEKITNLFSFNGVLGNQSTTILKNDIVDVNNTPNIGDFIIDKDNNLFQITGEADIDNFYGTFVSNIQGPKGEQGADGLSLGNNAWCFNYKTTFTVPSNKIVALYEDNIDTPFNYDECQIDDLVIFSNGQTFSASAGLTTYFNVGTVTAKSDGYISVRILTHILINRGIYEIPKIGDLLQNININISQNNNGHFNIYNDNVTYRTQSITDYGANKTMDLTYTLPLKGSDTIVVDIAEDNESIEIHLDSEIVNDLSRTLKTPVTTPETTQIVAIDSTGAQTLLELGTGVSIENETIVSKTNMTRILLQSYSSTINNISLQEDYHNFSLLIITGYETNGDTYTTLTLPVSIISINTQYQIALNNSSNNRYAKISFNGDGTFNIDSIDTFTITGIFGVK